MPYKRMLAALLATLAAAAFSPALAAPLAAPAVRVRLAPPAASAAALAARPASAPLAALPKEGPRQKAEALLHVARRWTQEYYFYNVTNIRNKWPPYRDDWRERKAAGAVNVSRPRAFFARMRVAGSPGGFHVLGSVGLRDDLAVASFRSAFRRWFDGPGLEPAGEALDRFMERARAFNAERRAASNMRRHIRDAMLAASTLAPGEIPAYFDSLLTEESARRTAAFQADEQERVLAAYRRAVRETLEEETRGAEGEIVAAVLLGSFATGAAGPGSDLDVEVVSRDGRATRARAFAARLVARWKALGLQGAHMISLHDNAAYIPLRAVLDLTHDDPYVLVARDAELQERLERKPGEKPAFTRPRLPSVRGSLSGAAQAAVAYVSTWLGDLLPPPVQRPH